MPVQPIRIFGDPVLRTPAEPVVDFDKELRVLVKDLTETMQDAPGAGLAAPQIGVGLRVFVYDVDDVVGHLINPTLDLSEEEQDGDGEHDADVEDAFGGEHTAGEQRGLAGNDEAEHDPGLGEGQAAEDQVEPVAQRAREVHQPVEEHRHSLSHGRCLE